MTMMLFHHIIFCLLCTKAKTIYKSVPQETPPVIVPYGLDAQRKEDLRWILLIMHEKVVGVKRLKSLIIDCPIDVSGCIHTNVRNMQDWFADV